MTFSLLSNAGVRMTGTLRLKRAPRAILVTSRARFSATAGRPAKNRVYNSAEEFNNLVLLSSSSRVPLITLWTASWCGTCAAVAPLIQALIEAEGVGETDGRSVAFAEVELDAPDVAADVAPRYMVTGVPLLLAFDRQEPQMDSRVTDPAKLKDRAFLTSWIEKEAERAGRGGAGGSLFGGLFGGSS